MRQIVRFTIAFLVALSGLAFLHIGFGIPFALHPLDLPAMFALGWAGRAGRALVNLTTLGAGMRRLAGRVFGRRRVGVKPVSPASSKPGSARVSPSPLPARVVVSRVTRDLWLPADEWEESGSVHDGRSLQLVKMREKAVAEVGQGLALAGQRGRVAADRGQGLVLAGQRSISRSGIANASMKGGRR